jgi:hypothetical protein
LQKYLALPQSGKVIAEYVWIDGSNGIRSKSKVSHFHRFSCSQALPAAFATPETWSDWVAALYLKLGA